MSRALRWLVLAVPVLGASLVLLAGILWGVSRALTPTAAERAALERLQAPVAVSGSNAFARMWLIEYEVPEAELEGVAAADAARMRAALAAAPGELAPELPTHSSALGRYPRIEAVAGDIALCKLREDDCLAHVRTHRAALAQRLAREAALLARVRSLAGHGHYRSAFPAATHTPLPPFQWLALSHTQAALDFIDGRHAAALHAVCRDVTTWRRLASHSDSLVLAMVGVAAIDADARLLAQMLAELPQDAPLPESCAGAFDPAASRPDLCMAMQGEAAGVFALYERMAQVPRRVSERLVQGAVFDAQRSKARYALAVAPVCSAALRAQLADDTPLAPPPGRGRADLGCMGNWAGCTLVDVAAPEPLRYLARVQDAQAMLATIDTLLWLRGKRAADGMRPEALRHWLDARGPRRATRLDPAGRRIGFVLRDTSKAWSVPLPASRLAAAGSAAGSPAD